MPTISNLSNTGALSDALIALFSGGTATRMSATSLIIESGNFKASFLGTGLDYDAPGGFLNGFSAGTLNGLNLLNGSTVVARLTALNLDAAAFPDFNDPNASLLLRDYFVSQSWTVNGTQGADTLNFATIGQSFGVRINGLSGNDSIVGGNGADTIGGWSGHDTIYLSAGNDLVRGDAGNDTVLEVTGVVSGNDTLHGGVGNDSLSGGAGHDFLFGDTGKDHLWGAADNDWIYGGGSNDKLYGGDGADTLRGDVGNDTIWGDAGADFIYSGAGRDVIYGGADVDQFQFSKGDGPDTIKDFDASTESIFLYDFTYPELLAVTIKDTAAGALVLYDGGRLTIENIAAADLVWNVNLFGTF